MSCIFHITRVVELKYGGFGVARLVMLSGVQVRRYTEVMTDIDTELMKVQRAARQLLMPDDCNSLPGPCAALIRSEVPPPPSPSLRPRF